MKPSSFIIIGSGPLGIGLAMKLEQLALVSFFLGKSGPQKVDATVFSGSEPLVKLNLPAPTMEHLAKAKGVFLAVKAHHLEEALEQHKSFLPPGVPLISLGNGAVAEILLKFYERQQTWPMRLGVATLAISRLSENKFALRSTAERIHWGPLSPPLAPPCEGEAELFHLGKPNFHWHEDPIPLYRRKWLFNSVLNSLAATTRARSNGELLSDQLQLRRIFVEAYALGTAHWGHWEASAETIYHELVELIQKTEANENSMALDVRLGRSTETDYLAGIAERYEGFPLLKSLHRALRF